MTLGMGFFSSAQAVPILNGSFNVDIWHQYYSTARTINNPYEQAATSNPMFNNSTYKVGSFTYTGSINFNPGSNNLQAFFNSAGGTITNFAGANAYTQTSLANIDLSTSGFKDTTLMQFTGWTTPIFGTVTHDDGASIYSANYNTVYMASALPTSATPTPYVIPGGQFHLLYVEANGLPAQLTMKAAPVPEPTNLGMMGLGLFMLGMLGLRLRKTGAGTR